MDQPSLTTITQSQQERLFHIDFKLYFLGMVNRNDLVARFGIEEAAATRDLSLYRKLAPESLFYDSSVRTYVASDTFIPMFEHSATQAIAALARGIGDDFVGESRPIITTDTPINLQEPQLNTLAVISRAIHQGKAVEVTYFSLSSGKSQRQVVPFALVDSGLRWHVRLFDRKRRVFTDFNINRISEATLLTCEVEESERRESDIQWNRIVDMELIPHPNVKYPETIEVEYTMQNGLMKVNARAAVVGYFLRRWNIDSSPDHSCNGREYHLWLRNWQTLYGVSNAMLAPGYSEEAYQSKV